MAKVYLVLTLWSSQGAQLLSGNACMYRCYASNLYLSMMYSHSISSGRWTTLYLAADHSRNPATIFDALNSWMGLNTSGLVGYTDLCQGMVW